MSELHQTVQKSKKILCVGAGFAGAVVAREMAEAGHKVLVLEKRDHIGGNAYDFVNEHGIRVHKYGPHIWHTNNQEAHNWFSKFTDWVPYEHEVKAQLADGSFVPLPINADTINEVLNDELRAYRKSLVANGISLCTDEMYEGFLETQRVKLDGEPKNSRELVEASVGKKLCELFFAPYSKKMWGMDLSDLPAGIAKRIPTRTDYESRYFPNDAIQMMPKEGYTKAFEKMFDHPNITVWLNTTRQDCQELWDQGYFKFSNKEWDGTFDHVFTSEALDEYFDFKYGELPWRSIKFHTVTLDLPSSLPASVVNFTHDGPMTRVTEWKNFPNHGTNPYKTTLTFEEPCDYKDNNNERYYPVKSSSDVDENREIYQKYKEELEGTSIHAIGRCGTYQYLDMWMVIAQTLKLVNKILVS